MDTTMKYPKDDGKAESFNLTKTLFPNAYADHKSMTMLAEPLWEAFQDVRIAHHIATEDIPMRYAIDALAYCFMKYSVFSRRGEVFPCKDDLLVCVKESGYLSGEQIDEHLIQRSRKITI